METLFQDIRYGIRTLAKKPLFTAIAVIALALGIGANSAIFSVVNTVLLSPLPYKEADRLAWIWETNLTNDIPKEPASGPNFTDWRNQSQTFEDMTAFTQSALILSSGGEPERITGGVVSSNFFSVLRADPALGRTFVDGEDKPGNNRVLILSHGLWQRRFGGDPDIIDTVVTMNGNPYTVIGVMPQGFRHPNPESDTSPQFWMPFSFSREVSQLGRRSDFLHVVARLKPGATLDQARAEMAGITANLAQQYPQTNTDWGVTIVSLHERFVGDIKLSLIVIMAAVGFLLLIACANVANLLLTRAASRQKEISIRIAMGASRGRLVKQLITESLILSLVGGVLGCLLALWGVDALIGLSPGQIPRLSEATIDARVLGFTLAVSILTGLVFGLVPALQTTKLSLTETLKEGDRGSTEGFRGRRMRNTLVVVEVALSLVLLIGAGLMIRSFLHLQRVDPGFSAERLLTVQLGPPASKYPENQKVVNFYNQLLEKLAATPGIQGVSAVNALPMTGSASMWAFSIEGQPLSPTGADADAEVYRVSPDYFQMMGIAILSGRGLSQQDHQDAPPALVINETFAKRYFPGEDPIGKRITFGDPAAGEWQTIVGVARDVKHRELDVEAYSQVYATYQQTPSRGMYLMMRTASADPLSMVSAFRTQLWSLDAEQPLYNVKTMDQVMSESISRPRFNMVLMAVFAGVALVLAAVGIYGVMSYSVSQRTHEIGIRMALGAQRQDVVKLVVGQGMMLAGAGVVIGAVAGVLLTRFISSLLFQTSASDPLTFIAISLLLIAVAFVACYIPARRATRVDPMIALRYE